MRFQFKITCNLLQDPLEWSHNVSMLVSEKYISAMRRQMMFALSRMKIAPDSFLTILQGVYGTDAGTKSSLGLSSFIFH